MIELERLSMVPGIEPKSPTCKASILYALLPLPFLRKKFLITAWNPSSPNEADSEI